MKARLQKVFIPIVVVSALFLGACAPVSAAKCVSSRCHSEGNHC